MDPESDAEKKVTTRRVEGLGVLSGESARSVEGAVAAAVGSVGSGEKSKSSVERSKELEPSEPAPRRWRSKGNLLSRNADIG